MRLKDKVALVTGAGGGIGTAVTKRSPSAVLKPYGGSAMIISRRISIHPEVLVAAASKANSGIGDWCAIRSALDVPAD